MKFILASQSPRRKVLLKKIIPDFEICVSNADENVVDYKDVKDFAVKASKVKAAEIVNILTKKKEIDNVIIISADTIVTLNNIIYGKPKNEEDAKRIIRELMGHSHQVITGFTIFISKQNQFVSDYEISDVVIRNLNEKELDNYVKYSGCFDKAGAYGIQDMKSFEKNNVTGNTVDFDIVKSYSGSYDNIVGLPVEKIKETFENLKIKI